jgi:hypothetical protein
MAKKKKKGGTGCCHPQNTNILAHAQTQKYKYALDPYVVPEMLAFGSKGKNHML